MEKEGSESFGMLREYFHENFHRMKALKTLKHQTTKVYDRKQRGILMNITGV